MLLTEASSGKVQSDSEGWFGFEGLPMKYEIFAEWPACEHLVSAKVVDAGSDKTGGDFIATSWR